MIWYISTKDLMEKYSKRSFKKLERTNYIIMSSCVRITKEHDNVLNVSPLFMNAGLLKGVGFDIEPDSITAKEQFKSYLLKNPKGLSILCALIECTLLEDEDSVIICSPKEMKYGYIQTFSEVVSQIFSFPILKYPNETSYNPEEVIRRLLYYRDAITKFVISKGTKSERTKLIAKMNKKELKKELKLRNLYSSTMSTGEMRDILSEFYRIKGEYYDMGI